MRDIRLPVGSSYTNTLHRISEKEGQCVNKRRLTTSFLGMSHFSTFPKEVTFYDNNKIVKTGFAT